MTETGGWSTTSGAPVGDLDDVLYPCLAPYKEGFLDVGSGHRIYVEESGNADGRPVVVLHGGPGSGSSPMLRRFFDPEHFRVISFDQRGCGRSQPLGALRDNTMSHLVDDIETLRRSLGIDSWLVCGGSWGATLALVYGITHPDVCAGFLLRSIALGRAAEFRWWIDRMRLFFPEAWDAFAGHVAEDVDTDLLAAYHSRLSSDDIAVSTPAAVEWLRYEGACSSLLPTEPRKLRDASAEQLVSMARIEAHYFANKAFLENDWILGNIRRVTHLPAAIVHGRYDVICPPVTAYELAKAWTVARLRIVAASGHSFRELALAAAFVEETNRAKAWRNPPCAGSDHVEAAAG